jgi:hypothetical protein
MYKKDAEKHNMFLDPTLPGLIDSMSRTMDSFNIQKAQTLGGISNA